VVSYFYKILFWAAIATLPFAFLYNSELFQILNCPKNGGKLDMFLLLMTSLADGLWVVMIVTVVHSLRQAHRDALQGSRQAHFGAFVLALLVGTALLHSAKYFFDAPRPVIAMGDQVCVLGQRLTSRSFPSGHSFSAILLFMYLRPRRSVTVALAIAALCVIGVLSRAYVGAHFPRDMIVGALIAVFAYFAAEFVILKIRPWKILPGTRKILIAVPGLATALIYIFFYHEKTRELEFLLTPLAWAVVAYWLGFIVWRGRQLFTKPPSGTGSSPA
jgi:membrane-associated phospholipid phosphatase